jgi:DNA polymerase-1
MPESLYIVDVSSIIFQVFHAIPEMTGRRGQPTNAVFGVTRDLFNIIRGQKPTYVVCAIDAEGPAERVALFSDGR